MSDGSHEQDETPTFKFDKIQMGAMMVTLMKKMDKKLQFERASFATDNVLGTSSQVRKAAREKRKGKRPAAVEEHEDLYTSSGRSTDDARSVRATSQTRRMAHRVAQDRADDSLGNLKLRIPSFSGTNDPGAYLEWEKNMELVFDCQNFSESKKVRLAVTEFNRYALHWWDQIVTTRRRTGGPQVSS